MSTLIMPKLEYSGINTMGDDALATCVVKLSAAKLLNKECKRVTVF